MKHLLFSLTILFSVNLEAQEEAPKPVEDDFNRFQIGVSYAPEMSYRTLLNVDGSNAAKNTIDFRNEMELPKYGFTAGINGCYNISRKIGFEAGILFSNKGYQERSMFYTVLNTDGTYQELGKHKYIYQFHYIDIPLKANFTLGKQKVRFLASAGIVTSIFVSSAETHLINYYDDGVERATVEDPFKYKRGMLSAMIGAGIDYAITQRMTLRVEPRFRYGLTRIIDNTPISARLGDFGINVGYYITM
jgi:Outer membrane protein beta-barrel domain